MPDVQGQYKGLLLELADRDALGREFVSFL